MHLPSRPARRKKRFSGNMAEMVKDVGSSLARKCENRLNSLKGSRAPWEPVWDELGRMIMPRKAGRIYNSSSPSPDTSSEDELFDSTGVFANQTLANGQMSYITPADSRWFTLDAPMSKKGNDKIDQWFQKCSEIMQAELALSNFYSEIHELYFDDGCFGTSCMTVLPGKVATLNFETLPIGSYWIDEDDEGNIDTLFREMQLSARQCEMKFRKENLSPKMATALEKFHKDGKQGAVFIVAHGIYPRPYDEREAGKTDGKNKPWRSVYFVPGENHLISDSGFDEKAFFAARHALKSGDIYGISPGMASLADLRQLNFLVKQMDALAEVAAFPRVLIPSSMVDEVDLRAGGPTIFNENAPTAMPREWATGGRYDVGLDREKRKQAAVERLFYVDLFQMFSQTDKQMTAREVSERASEKLAQFTPAFARKTSELITPLLQRAFGICSRAGKFPPPPMELAEEGPDGLFIPDPSVAYNSRVALAIKALQNTAFFRTMEINGPLAQLHPEIMDNYDLDKISRDTSRNDGLPADWMRDKDVVEELRAGRAKAREEAQQQQQMLEASQAVKNVSGVQPGSMAEKAISGAAGAALQQ